MRFITFILISVLSVIMSCGQNGPIYIVDDEQSFNSAVKNAVPGDTIVLKNGEYTDFDQVFTGSGTKEKPIVFTAETPGKVVFSGQSRIRLGGEYLVISGLMFTNGYTPGQSVIEFRINNQKIANNCRVTNCVVDNYNQPDRFHKDNWILLYGKNNRVDHNTFTRKKNSGVTLAVKLIDEKSQQNRHQIDHNFFAYRPRLGSNGGETMRVGVSSYSLTSSYTNIEKNLFYKCNGETEVASIKSSDNYIRFNTFMECEGSLVMRHGNRNIIEGNYFLGNNKPHTGGIRVINAGHRIFNNYLSGVKGERFRSALAVMNGVPNSLLNRYHQVKDAVIANNTFINCDHIELGAGSDFERTAVPENTFIGENIIVHDGQYLLFEKIDDIRGITFSRNIGINKNNNFNRRGFIKLDPNFIENEKGLWVPTANTISSPLKKALDFIKTDITGMPRPANRTIGAVEVANGSRVKLWADFDNTGARWFTPKEDEVVFGTGKVISVRPGVDTIPFAVKDAKPGDIIELAESGDYLITQTSFIKVPLTIRAKNGLTRKPLLIYMGESGGFGFISIEDGGSLKISGLTFDGGVENVEMPSAAIRTSKKPMIEHYRLFVDSCDFIRFQSSRNNAFRAYKSTYADTILFTNCLFNKISGDAISLAAEKEDKGIYNAEYVFLINNVFDNVMGAALNFYRGGNDESTFGPFLTVDHCVFHNVNNKEQGSVLRLIGVQNAEIKNSNFVDSGRGGRSIKFEESRWNHISVHHCNIYNSGRVESYYPNVVGSGMKEYKPEFTDAANWNFTLKKGSGLLRRGSDRKPIGIQQ